MKKFIITIILALFSLAAFAKAPNLNVEKLFDGSYNSNPSVSIFISKAPEKYFRGCTVSENHDIVKKIVKLYEKDLKRAQRSQDLASNGSKFSSMTIINNGQEIYIGLSMEQNNGCYLFISGPLEAFK